MKKIDGSPDVTIVPSILVYISPQREFVLSFKEIIRELSAVSGAHFHIFIKNTNAIQQPSSNISVYPHGDKRFYSILAECNGIISTAGHSLLSEAMFLGIPVYAIPLAVYEQQMNAHVIETNGFGISRSRIIRTDTSAFVVKLQDFSAAIENDRSVLLRRPGQQEIIKQFEYVLDRDKGSVF